MKTCIHKFRLSELSVVKYVSYRSCLWKRVARTRDKVLEQLRSVLSSDGRTAALQLWRGELEEKLARSGGAQKKGENLTQKVRARGCNKKRAISPHTPRVSEISSASAGRVKAQPWTAKPNTTDSKPRSEEG